MRRVNELSIVQASLVSSMSVICYGKQSFDTENNILHVGILVVRFISIYINIWDNREKLNICLVQTNFENV